MPGFYFPATATGMRSASQRVCICSPVLSHISCMLPVGGLARPSSNDNAIHYVHPVL